MKRFITLLILVGSMIFIPSCAKASQFEVEIDGVSYTYEQIEEIQVLIDEQYEVMDAAHRLADAARELNYSSDHITITTAQSEYMEAQKKMEECVEAIEELKTEYNKRFEDKTAEYPEATTIWKYLKQQGYNDYVCAGIMGNLMTEVGGQTLALKPYASNSNYYGMCQWNKAYSEVWGQDLIGQCKFLNKTMKYEFNTFGRAYKKGFDFSAFTELENERKAALAFAKCYERCGSGSYEVRQNNAEKAYNYFVK